LLGFQAVSDLPEANLFMFEHSCGSSISILAKRLRHLLPVTKDEATLPSLFGTNECHAHCKFLDHLVACDRPCANRRDRRLLLMLLEMKRHAC
jgi:hypothetical protein